MGMVDDRGRLPFVLRMGGILVCRLGLQGRSIRWWLFVVLFVVCCGSVIGKRVGGRE